MVSWRFFSNKDGGWTVTSMETEHDITWYNHRFHWDTIFSCELTWIYQLSPIWVCVHAVLIGDSTLIHGINFWFTVMGVVYGDSWGKQPTNVGASSRLNMAIFDGKLLDDPRVMELWEDYFMILWYIYTHIYSIAICWRNLGRRKKENCLEGI